MSGANEKEEVIDVSKIIFEGVLFEQVYNKETGVAGFCGYDERNDQVIEKPSLTNGNIKFNPII